MAPFGVLIIGMKIFIGATLVFIAVAMDVLVAGRIIGPMMELATICQQIRWGNVKQSSCP